MRSKKISLPHRNLLIVFFVFLSFPLLILGTIRAASIDDITARVDVSVCGDHQAEGDEECDWNDYNGVTCESFGYAGGSLNCTIACEIDYSECISPTPTPIPTITVAPTTTQTGSSSNSPSSNTASSDSSGSDTKQGGGAAEKLLEILTSKIPNGLKPFDTNNDNKISFSETTLSVKSWVESWENAKKIIVFDSSENKPVLSQTQSCDINNDGICNLIDFSILLYYVGR